VGLVAQRGVEGFSLREAARAVGVSPAAAYRHFEDKDALLAALAADGFVRLAAVMEKAIKRIEAAPGTPAHAVQAFGAVGLSYVEFAVQRPSQFRVMFGPWCAHSEELSSLETPGGRDPYDILVAALDALVASGAVRPEARAGTEIVAWSGVHGLASLIVEGPLELSKETRAQSVALLGRTLLLGMGCDAALLGPPPPPPPDTEPPARKADRRRR
jgi:AcrR family transcriptional regulator